MWWIYVLQCENDYYYVGETTHLYKRFWQHTNGLGGLNTSINKIEKIVAIYKVDTINKFIYYNNYVNSIIDGTWFDSYSIFELKKFSIVSNETETSKFDALEAENSIAECLIMHNKGNWNNIRGGKYTRFDIDYSYPNKQHLLNLPLCHCKLPCDIRKNDEKEYLYFRCAKKNMWDQFKIDFEIDDDPCNFYMEYILDKPYRIENSIKQENNKLKLKELFKTSKWLINVEENDDTNHNKCIGGCSTTNPDKKIFYRNKILNLCYNCFIGKNEMLCKKYKKAYSKPLIGKCLINL